MTDKTKAYSRIKEKDSLEHDVHMQNGTLGHKIRYQNCANLERKKRLQWCVNTISVDGGCSHSVRTIGGLRF